MAQVTTKIKPLHQIAPAPLGSVQRKTNAELAYANNWLLGLGIDPKNIHPENRAADVAAIRAELVRKGHIMEHMQIHGVVARRQALAARIKGTREALRKLRKEKGIAYPTKAIKKAKFRKNGRHY